MTFKIPHKVIISGEFSCIFGYPVLTTTIPLYIAVEVNYSARTRKENIVIRTSDKETVAFAIESEAVSGDLVEQLYRQICSYLNARDQLGLHDVTITFGATAFVSYGLGSSANFLIALFLSICEVAQIPCLDKQWLASHFVFLKALEDQFHGKSSGIDILTILKSEFALYAKENDKWVSPCTTVESLAFWMLLVKSHKPKNTKSSVSDLLKQLNTDSVTTQQRIEAIGRTTVDIFNHVARGYDIEKLHSLLNTNQDLLTKLRLSDQSIDNIVENLGTLGIGAKLTGGGRGGCVISLLSEQEHNMQKTAISSLLEKDYEFHWFYIKTEEAPGIQRIEHSNQSQSEE